VSDECQRRKINRKGDQVEKEYYRDLERLRYLTIHQSIKEGVRNDIVVKRNLEGRRKGKGEDLLSFNRSCQLL